MLNEERLTSPCIQHSSFSIQHFLRGAPMFLARVTGNVVATQKDKTLNGQKLFVVEPLNVKYDEQTNRPASLGNTGRAIVAIDSVGAGEGQLVLVVQGSSARMTEQTRNLPADAVIVGIVDSAEFAGKTFYGGTGDSPVS